MTIGERIKDARKASGFTQEQLAKMCGLATVTIRQYESNKRRPGYEQLRLIADETKTTLSFYLSSSEDESATDAKKDREQGDQIRMLTNMVIEFISELHGKRHLVEVQGTYLTDELIVYGYGDTAIAFMSTDEEDIMAEAIHGLLVTLVERLSCPVESAIEIMKKELSDDSAKENMLLIAKYQKKTDTTAGASTE